MSLNTHLKNFYKSQKYFNTNTALLWSPTADSDKNLSFGWVNPG